MLVTQGWQRPEKDPAPDRGLGSTLHPLCVWVSVCMCVCVYMCKDCGIHFFHSPIQLSCVCFFVNFFVSNFWTKSARGPSRMCACIVRTFNDFTYWLKMNSKARRSVKVTPFCRHSNDVMWHHRRTEVYCVSGWYSVWGADLCDQGRVWPRMCVRVWCVVGVWCVCARACACVWCVCMHICVCMKVFWVVSVSVCVRVYACSDVHIIRISPGACRKKQHCTEAWAPWTSMHYTADRCKKLKTKID